MQSSKLYRSLIFFIIFALMLALARQALAVQDHQAGSPTPVVRLYGSAPDEPDSQLQAIVDDTVGDLPGTWGVAIKKLDTGQYAAFNGDTQQVSASLYKLWVLSELYHQVKEGNVSLDDDATVTGDDTYYDMLQDDLIVDQGTNLSLRAAARLMITLSDNTSAHLLVRTLGPDNVNSFMQDNGLSHSVLDWSGVGDNLTTPLDVMHELEMMATSQMVDADSSSEMIQLMLDQQINNLLPVGLPDGTPFAHKTGSLDGLLHDAGIVYGPTGPFIIVVMASNLNSYNMALNNMPALAQKVYQYFTSRPTEPALYFPQTRESVGHDFLKFWYEYGGVEQFGYPTSPEVAKDGVLVQEFERARLEWHPENANAGGPQPQVELGLVGQERAAQAGLSWPPGQDGGTGKFFPQTGQTIAGAFLDYWMNHGEERAFGYPLSPASDMVNPADGKHYLTQWFQRARMEIHPELPPGQQVVLGTLGTELAAAR